MVPIKFGRFNWLDNDSIAAWTFLAPALLFLGTFLIWPIAYLFYLSFTSGSFTQSGVRWIGLNNYWRLVTNPDFWQIMLPANILSANIRQAERPTA